MVKYVWILFLFVSSVGIAQEKEIPLLVYDYPVLISPDIHYTIKYFIPINREYKARLQPINRLGRDEKHKKIEITNKDCTNFSQDKNKFSFTPTNNSCTLQVIVTTQRDVIVKSEIIFLIK